MAEFAPEMPVKSALVPIGAESVRRCSSVPPMREGAHFGAGLIHPGQAAGRRLPSRATLERWGVLAQLLELPAGAVTARGRGQL